MNYSSNKEECETNLDHMLNLDEYWDLFHTWNKKLLEVSKEMDFHEAVVRSGCIEVPFGNYIIENFLPQLKNHVTFFNGNKQFIIFTYFYFIFIFNFILYLFLFIFFYFILFYFLLFYFIFFFLFMFIFIFIFLF